MGLLTTLKGLPSTYDKDLQEDKEPVFDAFDTLMVVMPVMAGVIGTMTLQPARMAAQLEPSLLATDLADYLVRKGVPFRDAHHLVGAVVQRAEERGVGIDGLAANELAGISPHFGDDVAAVFDVPAALARRNIEGGTAPEAIRRQIVQARATLTT